MAIVRSYSLFRAVRSVSRSASSTAKEGPARSPVRLRPVNCLAAGVPVGFVNTPARTQTLEIVSSGNPFLQEETGKSLTLGGVLTPRWVPGLSISVDYYRIRVKNLIATLGGQTILNQCFDLPQPNQFCALLFPRNPDSTFPSPTLISAGANFAKQEAAGTDMELAYRN